MKKNSSAKRGHAIPKKSRRNQNLKILPRNTSSRFGSRNPTRTKSDIIADKCQSVIRFPVFASTSSQLVEFVFPFAPQVWIPNPISSHHTQINVVSIGVARLFASHSVILASLLRGLSIGQTAIYTPFRPPSILNAHI